MNDTSLNKSSYDSLEEERLATCPIKPRCKHPDDEMMLRSIRSDRLLCSYCYVHTPTGYMGKEEAKASDDRFFTGTSRDYLITAGIIFPAALIVCIITLFVAGFGGFFSWMIAIFIGTAAGSYIATLARQATGRRVGRQSATVAIIAVALAAILTPTVYIFLRFGVLTFNVEAIINIPLILCAGTMGAAIYNRFMRRI
ncbi:hypothetical protein G4Y79_04125 [Phototrophicus methaneseepsis]|uniref:Uncharacterized protein n=1 Tax=Phototrophicus methaneseepsis TaxID=2710758 RepID=A0A7S8IFK9_9CHLR|nr:hypothetical protein [Phototrophicus methaneseepsis]QPC83579.1 hypothetical protein G4Y79_04125 [Phototrophicus methaneseepsis]